ncbi:MAG: helix-turn-helix domain-containing protein [Acidimicrobiales bacterium]
MERSTPRDGRQVELDHVVAGIGAKIHMLRKERRLSLQALAERAGVSSATIHKIERNGMVPTIATLMKLATALNRTVGYLVEEDQESGRPVAYVPAEDRRPVYTSKQGIELGSISGPYGRFFMAGAAAVVEPGADSGEAPMVHAGEELLHVVSGVLELEIDREIFRLRRGDSLHFRTDHPHRWRNPGSQPAKAIWMSLRPS